MSRRTTCAQLNLTGILSNALKVISSQSGYRELEFRSSTAFTTALLCVVAAALPWLVLAVQTVDFSALFEEAGASMALMQEA